MSLTIVATPIGNPGDLSFRALSTLRCAQIIICEELKEGRRFLKKSEIPFPRMELLNEHSTQADVKELANLCATHAVALISDCGTPGFCDPGAPLVALCRKQGIPVTSVPGASSLMTFLSLCGRRLDQFIFMGFLPVQPENRQQALRSLKSERRALILMDTPYRLNRLMEELARTMPDRTCVLGINLTADNERILEGSLSEVSNSLEPLKAEFILLLDSIAPEIHRGKNNVRTEGAVASKGRRR